MNIPFLALVTLSASLLSAAEWPQWRGPDGQGCANVTGLPRTWSESNNVSWKVELPGRAWASPVIDGKQIWLTTALEQAGIKAGAEHQARAIPGKRPPAPLELVEFRALCVDRDTGNIIYNLPLLSTRNLEFIPRANSYASCTPVIEDGRLYCHFGAMGNVCLDMHTGKVLWSNTNLVVTHENGPGSSPVLWKNLMVFHLDGNDHQFVVALNKHTGLLAWKTPRSGEVDKSKSYASPLVVTVNGREQLISPASGWVYGYNELGSEIWRIKYGVFGGYALTQRPVSGHGLFYFSTGFWKPHFLAVRYEGLDKPEIAWRHEKGTPAVASPLLVGEELYFVNDTGMLTCLDAKTGGEHYRERLGGNFSAAPTYGDGKIYFHNQEGMTVVLKPGKSFEVLAKNQLSGRIFASLAVADHALFLRTDTALYRLENKPTKQAAK